MAAIKALEQWCKLQCDGYRDVSITNMTTSFRNGLAFCALIHKYRPDLIDYDSLRQEDVFENNMLAFQVAEEKLGIPALLDAEDMVALRIPDRLSILTYVSQYYNYFKGRPPMGGVKRPAEGSKEEPSEKKNLPVVAKTFVSKTAIENCLPSIRTAQTSPKLARAAAQVSTDVGQHLPFAFHLQKVVLTENTNKNGTLNSKCVACKSHVHLVQRHFVEGKLYHRSCFKCNECSSVLHAGSYKPGKNPDTFICNAHQNNFKPSTSEAAIKNGPAVPNSASQTQPAPRPSLLLSASPSIILKPICPPPPSQSWTASAQRTQAARQKFFQAAPQVPDASTGNRKEPISISGRSKVAASVDDEKSRARGVIGKKLAEENCNNNNKRPFTIRSPSSADSPGLRKDKCSQGPAGNWGGQASTSQTNNKESPCLKAINKDNTRPTTVHKTAKGKPEQIERELNDIETNLAQLEKEGVELEKKLRSCEEEGEADILMDPLMVDWFNLIRKKQMYIRKESELVYIARTQELEQQQPGVEGELRRLLEKPDHLKSREEQQREKKLMQRLMEIVDGRNAIVEGLDEDRRREVEEDLELNKMMQNLGVKKSKNKRKTSISKLFRRRSKRRVE
uniref:Mical-like 2a n=1 Tax=Amphiprion ocellaris TaxID=80972 RepID=A0AAQ5XBJ9_AMPOC